MTSSRVYRKGLQKDVAVALKEIENGEGGQLDPKLALIFVNFIKTTER